jgi:hypothetical protein
MVLRTAVCKKGRPKLDLQVAIISEIGKNENPLSTSDLAATLNRAWHTIDRACLMLQLSGKIEGFKVGKMNLWRLNG